MAIIKGVTAAKVGDIKPYEDDVDLLAKGILARDMTAKDNLNAILKTKESLIKDTRDNPEDWALAQSLEKEYADTTDALINKADQDYSIINRGDLTRAATNIMGKTEWRVLTEAKRNADEATKQRQAIETKGGVPIKFGPKDPIADKLYQDDGTPNTFTNQWSYEEALDHPQAAKKLFDQIGVSLFSNEHFKNDPNFTQLGTKQLSSGQIVKDWVAYWEKTGDKYSNNWNQVNSIINNMINGFKESPEGRQYYKIHYENMLYGRNGVPQKSEQEAREYAQHKIVELVKSAGESEKIDTEEHSLDRTPIGRANDEAFNPSTRKSSGSGVNDPERIVSYVATTDEVSYKGLLPGDEKGVFDIYQEGVSTKVSIPNVAEVTKRNEGSISNMTNPHMIAASSLMVANPEGDNNSNVPQTGEGLIYKLGNQIGGSDPKKNPAAIHFKQSNDNTINTTTAINYSNFKVKDGKIVTENTIKNPDGSSKVVEETRDVDQLIELLGDDLFHNSDFDAINSPQFQDGYTFQPLITNDPIVNNARKGNGSSRSLSTYTVDPNTGEVSISPVLTKLQEYYEFKLKSLKPGSAEAILFEAKRKKVEEKIKAAEYLKDTNPNEFERVTKQIELANTQNRLLKENITMLGNAHNIPLHITNSLLGEGVDGTNNVFNAKVKDAKDKSYSALGLSQSYKSAGEVQYGIDNITNDKSIFGVPYTDIVINGKKFTANQIKAMNQKILNAWRDERENIISGNYNYDKLYNGEQKLELAKTLSSDPDIIAYLNRRDKMYSKIVQDAMNAVKSGEGKDLRKEFDKAFNENLQSSFGSTNPNLVSFVKDVETMNDIYTRKDITLFTALATGSEAGGYAEGTAEMKTFIYNQMNKGFRYARFGTTAQEELPKEKLDTKLMEIYEKEYSSGTKGFDEFKKEWLQKNFSGIRMDFDNPGSLFVAHYSLGQIDKNNFLEHDITLGMAEAVKYFGIPAAYFVTGDALKKGLQEHNQMFADLPGYNGKKGPRVHQYLFDYKMHGRTQKGQTAELVKGNFYLLVDEKYQDNPLSDPNLGSSDYHITDPTKRKLVFQTHDELIRFLTDKSSNSSIAVANQLTSILTAIKNGAAPDYILSPDNIFIQPDKKTGLPPSREEVIKRIEQALTTTLTGSQGFNTASSSNDYISAGAISKKEDGKLVIAPEKLQEMTNQEQAQLGITFNPKLKDQKWNTYSDGESYLADEQELVETPNLSATRIGDSKMRFKPDMANFVQASDKLMSVLQNAAKLGNLKRLAVGKSKGGTIEIAGVTINQDDLLAFEDLSESDMLTITSGLRSLQDNVRAYRNDLNQITVSPHMRGESIDVRTEPEYKIENGNKVIIDNPDRHYKAGRALLKFLQTPSGEKFLKQFNLHALYHDAGTGYHIDISKATSNRPAGKVALD